MALAVVTAWMAAACAQQQTAPAPEGAGAVSIERFALADGGMLEYLWLTPSTWRATGAPRFRVYVIPGSGCRGLAPVARAYFGGLREGEVVVVHKRHVRAQLWPEPVTGCSSAFVGHDSLVHWLADARAFMAWHWRRHPPRPDQPVALVGISEGAELLPALAADHPQLDLLALVGSTGLDPLQTLSLQAPRQGAPDFVAELEQQARDTRQADNVVWAGRTLGYWRSLVAWRHSQALLQLPQPLWLGFGSRDASVPLAGLDLFVQRAHDQGRLLCLALFPGSDHGLQRAGHDADLQQYWAWVASALMRRAPAGDCEPLAAAPPRL